MRDEPFVSLPCPEHHLSAGLDADGRRRCLVEGRDWRPPPPELRVPFLAPPALHDDDERVPRQRVRRWVNRNDDGTVT